MCIAILWPAGDWYRPERGIGVILAILIQLAFQQVHLAQSNRLARSRPKSLILVPGGVGEMQAVMAEEVATPFRRNYPHPRCDAEANRTWQERARWLQRLPK